MTTVNYLKLNVLPFCYVLSVNKKIEADIKKDDKKSEIDFYDSRFNSDDLIRLFKNEMERKKIIDDKAKTNLIGITAAIMFISPTIVLINGQGDFFSKIWGSIFFIFLSLGFISLVTGGLYALLALKIDTVYDIYFSDEEEIKNNGNTKLRNAKLIKYIKQNERMTNKRSNLVFASYIGIRNRIILIGVAVTVFAILFIVRQYSTNINSVTGNVYNIPF